MKLNNKGFSLIETIAVVVILAVLATIMIPSVSRVIASNKEKSYENLEQSIISSAKIYISDNRYDISLEESCGQDKIVNIKKIANNDNLEGKLPLYLLKDAGDMEEEIVDPRDREKKLDLTNSYILVTFDCNTKKYKYELTRDNNGNYVKGNLIWQ